MARDLRNLDKDAVELNPGVPVMGIHIMPPLVSTTILIRVLRRIVKVFPAIH